MTKNYEYNKAWRLRHPERRAKDRNRYYAKSQGAPNTGKYWTEEHDQLVLAHEIPDSELSEKIGRSVRAIQIRRNRINK